MQPQTQVTAKPPRAAAPSSPAPGPAPKTPAPVPAALRWQAFVINLKRDPDRWIHVRAEAARHGMPLQRVNAVDGSKLDHHHPDYHEKRYHRFHGRETNIRELGCYLSHLRAMRAFLDTDLPYGLICEDDITFEEGFPEVVEAALSDSIRWNILRLSGLGNGTPLKIKTLSGGYDLCANLGRLKGSGCYLLDRKAAARLSSQMLPMFLPHDHALDREWFAGLTALYVQPFPVSQVAAGFKSHIQCCSQSKLGKIRRYATTYPYQIFNELCRYVFRSAAWISRRLRQISARSASSGSPPEKKSSLR